MIKNKEKKIIILLFRKYENRSNYYNEKMINE